MKTLITEAIKGKKCIQFNYDDDGSRMVEPHCIGISIAGNPVLRAFQTSGHSLSGGTPDWRLFDLSKITGLKILEQTFPKARPDYHKGDKGMSLIHFEL